MVDSANSKETFDLKKVQMDNISDFGKLLLRYINSSK